MREQSVPHSRKVLLHVRLEGHGMPVDVVGRIATLTIVRVGSSHRRQAEVDDCRLTVQSLCNFHLSVREKFEVYDNVVCIAYDSL